MLVVNQLSEAIQYALKLWNIAYVQTTSSETTQLISENAHILHRMIGSTLQFNSFFNLLMTGQPDANHRHNVFRIKALMDVDLQSFALQLTKPVKAFL